MMLQKKIILILFLFVISLSLSCSNDIDSIRVKNWKILYNQDKSLESVLQKEGWEPVADISNIKAPYPANKDFQYVWLKGEFDIEGDPTACYGLSTGSIRFIDKIFINNRIIGSLSADEVNWSSIPRNYIVYEGVFKKGRNIIAIQLGIYRDESGGISDGVFIQGKEDFIRARLITNIVYTHIPIGMIFIYFALMMEFLIYYLWDRRHKHYIYASLSTAIAIVYILLSQPSYFKVSYELVHPIMFAGAIILSLLLLLFVQSFYRMRLYFSGINKVLIPLFLFLALFTIAFKETIYHTLTGYIFLFLTLAIIISGFVLIIHRLNEINRLQLKKSNIFLRPLTITVAVVFGLSIIVETYFMVKGKFYPGFIYIFFSPLTLIFSANIISREIKSRQAELDFLYNEMKIIGNEEKQKVISDTTEKKFEKIMKFMDDNFRSNLSKEGLAAAIDMHPNYMGSLFKAHTGKAIHEYLNNLRIEEAVRQLESGSGDLKIVDIAYAVGFESMSSFNRIFKNVTGKTPSEYKANLS